MDEVSAFVESKAYSDMVGRIIERTRIRLYPSYPPALQEVDRKTVQASGLTLDELRGLLSSDSDRLTKYAVAKIRKTRGETAVQEYPEGEEPGGDEADTVIEDRGYSRGFLLMDLVEYYLLKNRPEDLETYLKKRRIPQARNLAADLQNLFDRTAP
jgi:hypothetical protein